MTYVWEMKNLKESKNLPRKRNEYLDVSFIKLPWEKGYLAVFGDALQNLDLHLKMQIKK